MRVGINVGPARRTIQDVLGMAVNVASRICDEAGANEIWVSDECKKHIEQSVLAQGQPWIEHPPRQLKGVEPKARSSVDLSAVIRARG